MKILCFGDCNTWGLKEFGIRYDKNTRWTALLNTMLETDGYTIIEDGLVGRTVDSLQEESDSPKGFLQKSIARSYPFDVIIVSIGMNDLLASLQASAEDITEKMRKVIKVIQNYNYKDGSIPKIILTSVPYFRHGMDNLEIKYGFHEDAVERSKELNPLYRKLSEELGLYFFDTSKFIESNDISERDNMHLTPEGHKKYAIAMVEFIKNTKF